METKFIVNPAGIVHEVTPAHFERLIDESDPNDTFMVVKGSGNDKKLIRGHYREATAAEAKTITDATAAAAAHNRRMEFREESLRQADDERMDRMAELAEAGNKRGSK
jgi:hypothetical protein